MIKKGIDIFKLQHFWLMLMLTIILYGFSYNFSILLNIFPLSFSLIYFSINKGRNKINSNLIYFFGTISLYAFLLIVGGLISFDFDFRLKSAAYILLFLIPISLVFYNEVISIGLHNTHKYLLVSYFFLGVVVYFIYVSGYIESNRYQQVGNILAAFIVLLLGYPTQKRTIRAFLAILFSYFLLSVGSRQAIAGLFFCIIIYKHI